MTESGNAFELSVELEDGDEILSGELAGDSQTYPILRGVPNFVAEVENKQVADSFSFKWERFNDYGKAEHEGFLQEWLCAKLGLSRPQELPAFFVSRKRVLEVGPGSGFLSRYIAQQTKGLVFAADISRAAEVTYRNVKHLANCHVIQADLFDLPFRDNWFDYIHADGVLHHTRDARLALESLLAKLSPGGQMFFYLYRRQGPARQFCDRFLRERLGKLPADECFEACRGFTELGRELSRLNATIELKHGIPELGIEPGRHDVQRLIYYNVLKCFWNDNFDFDTNTMVNFDWYHPALASQHTPDEVEAWMEELAITEWSLQEANPNGISVLLRKP